MNKVKKVLYCLNNLDNGGVEVFCLNINRNIDRSKFKIDYLMMIGDKEYYKNEFENLGAHIYNINKIKKIRYIPRFLNDYLSVKNLIKQNDYKVIHVHQCRGTISILLAAYFNNVEIKCVHAHGSHTSSSNNFIIKFKSRIYSFIRKNLANRMKTYNLGCSKDACQSMFGKNSLENGKTKVIFNGIDLEKFGRGKYSKDSVRKKYNINKDKVNLISIGRYEEEKNHLFMIDVFNEMIELNADVKLTLIGHGSLEEEIKNKISKLGIEKYVTLLPQNTNVAEILSVMDYFLLPSLYEGLGIVLIEAQSSGVQCFVSSNVPEEANVGLCEYICLEIGIKGWAEYIINSLENKGENIVNDMKLKKYDIKNVVKDLERLYGKQRSI